MPDEWDLTDDEIDSRVTEWEAVDRAAAAYLAERIPGVRDVLTDDEARWLDALADPISQAEEPGQDEIESMSAVMALQHADWLRLALGVLHLGPGSALDPELVQADIARFKEVDGEIEDPEGHLAGLDMALVHLTPGGRTSVSWTRTSESQNAARGVCREPCTGPGAAKAEPPGSPPTSSNTRCLATHRPLVWRTMKALRVIGTVNRVCLGRGTVRCDHDGATVFGG